MVDFSSWNVSESRKTDLLELCQLACTNNLKVYPSCFLDNIAENIKSKLTISGKVIPDPGTFNSSSGIALLPNIDNFDTLFSFRNSMLTNISKFRWLPTV